VYKKTSVNYSEDVCVAKLGKQSNLFVDDSNFYLR